MSTVPIKAQAQACLDACTTLYALEARGTPPTPLERQTLAAFPGFGCVALTLFPNPVTGQYPDAGWEALGTHLRQLLTPEDYASAARSCYTAFYTPRLVMRALVLGLKHCGVPDTATVLEPGCGSGRFLGVAPATMACVGIEQETLSGRICALLYPQHDIRIQPIQRAQLDPESVDAVLGNVPFSQEKTAYWGRKLSLHELCIAKSLDALRPGGVLGLVVTHYLLDREQGTFRGLVHQRATCLGAIRLPADAFAAEGTRVVADLLFLQKRPAPPAADEAPVWLETAQIVLPDDSEQVPVRLNRVFVDDPSLLLGQVTRQDRLYGARHGYTVTSTGVLAEQLARALSRLPKQCYAAAPRLAVPSRLVAAPTAPLAEGTLVIDSGRVCQMQAGQCVPVCHGDSPILRTGVVGQRVAQLIGLRDQARAVLHLQQTGAPQTARRAARAELRQRYATFVTAYGPINTVALSERQDGTIVRRLPNLQTFRDLDPDAMRVMALEHYDEQTGTATLADIFSQDVVAPDAPITHCASAAEALLVVLSTSGRVDVSAMADLTGQPEDALVQELGDLLYHDPATQQWETADGYLSGHVKRKLTQAQAAAQQDPAYTRNVTALEAVQPPDLPPSAIAAHLGAPWIPADIIRDFAAETFHVLRSYIQVAHLAQDALWNIDAQQAAHATDAARVQFGTSRVSGVTLLQQALNLQAPTIYDPHPTDPDRRVKNEVETLAARDKQRQLGAHFQTWLWQDAVRAERCVRLYNALHNTHRARHFNGDHLTFPGMNPAITLTSPQQAAVWRIMTTGNTYLGHDVGAGKTYILVAAFMKMKQVGLIRKPLYVVKNTTLEQFGRMALDLYPQGRFLMAGPDDFHKDRRKLMAAKMASNQWDGIIITHSAFLHLGLSQRFYAEMLSDRVARYETLLIDHEQEHGSRHRSIRKDLERQKSTYEARLETLSTTYSKDEGLRFDELGIDALAVDEAHAFRKLETPTKMQRTAGVQGEGSGRAFDLSMKVRYLRTLRPGHGVVFASATPVCNTLGELFGIQTMLTPDALDDSGLAHFDAWAATFATVTEDLELGPDGQTLRPRVRLGEFANLPELQQMLTQFMDVQTAAQLALPIPQLAGGAPEEVIVPLSPDGRVYQEELVERYGKVRAGQARNKAEAILIMSEGRKLGVDARLVMPTAVDHAQSKLRAVAARVLQHWEQGQAARTTQLVFCDVGVNPTAWGFSAYAALTELLVDGGLPRHEIARIDQATSALARHRLCLQVQQGQVRVLLGSTEKLGTGTNVQERLVALHHVDVPLLPNEINQRQGRLLRQGNLHRAWGQPVHIYCYGTAGSVEATFWQILQTKAHFIHQFLSGATCARTAEDIGEQELTFAQMKAIVSGNPALRVLAETEAELRRLALLAKHHADARFEAQRRLRALPDEQTRQHLLRDQLQADSRALAAWDAVQGPRSVTEQVLTIEGVLAPASSMALSEAEARRLLDPVLEPVVGLKLSQTVRLGTYKGLPWGVSTSTWMGAEVWLQGQVTRRVALGRRTRPGVAALHALRELERDTAVRVAQAQHHVERLAQEADTAQARLGSPAPQQAYAAALDDYREQLEASLSAGGDATLQPELMRAIEALRESQRAQGGGSVARAETAPVPMAEAVTTRILAALAAQDAEETAAAD